MESETSRFLHVCIFMDTCMAVHKILMWMQTDTLYRHRRRHIYIYKYIQTQTQTQAQAHGRVTTKHTVSKQMHTQTEAKQEAVTQIMLKVDAVSTNGSQPLRSMRKKLVETCLQVNQKT